MLYKIFQIILENLHIKLSHVITGRRTETEGGLKLLEKCPTCASTDKGTQNEKRERDVNCDHILACQMFKNQMQSCTAAHVRLG